MSSNSKRMVELSAEEKRALLAELLKKKARAPKSFPMSFAQQRLWFLDQLEPGNQLYNIPLAVELKGHLDVAVLQQSLNEVIRRHEALRTTFAMLDGQPVQIITPELSLTLPVVDLRGLPEGEREKEARRLAQAEAQKPFDLACGPLVRAHLLRLSPDEHIALLTMHHIISDGWSMNVLVRELTTLYAAYLNGAPSPLPELPIQYVDFAQWQRQWLTDEVLEKQLSYWKQQLDGTPVLQLPTDRPRPALQTFNGARHTLALSESLCKALNALSRRQGVTLFMTLLGAWQVLLSRYSGQHDVAVGLPIAGRNRLETEALIGFFVNTLVMRTDLGGDPTFGEVLRRVREMTLEAHAHQDIPFEKLVEELQPERSLSYTPLFQVVFVLQNISTPSINLPGLSIKALSGEGVQAKFDLILTMEEDGDGLSAAFDYNTDLFDVATIERMAAHFQTLLEGIVSNPEMRVSELPLLTAAESAQLLLRWNDRASDYPRDKCIHELFEEQAESTPDNVAVVFGDEHLTYRELNERANRLAHYLRDIGVGPEVTVGLCVERSLEMVVGLLGILKAGGAYLPLDPQYPIERLSFMLEDGAVSVLLTQEHLLDVLPTHWSHVVCLDSDRELIEACGEENLQSVTQPENLAYVIYTSGSTGKPKGVGVMHRNVVRLVKENDYASFRADEVFLQLAPISFDASTFEIWGSLLNGARLVVMSPGVPTLEELGRALRQYGVTTLWLTAGLFHMMVDERLEDLAGVRQLLAGGDCLSQPHVSKVLDELEGVRVINGYGPTETTTFACCHPMTGASDIGASVPIGRPIANTAVYVLDDAMRPVAVGVAGELYIGGDGVARGYLNRAELTAERFVPDPFSVERGGRLYRTGDRVRYLADGRIEFLGRSDNQVKVRGFRIELGEIEAALGRHGAVSECVVVAREDAPGDKRLVAYVVTEGQLPVGELRDYLREKLPEYMVPSAVIFLDELPLTPNGKVDRRALPAPSDVRQEMEQSYLAPRTPIEEMLAGIWAEVLGASRVGVNDDFFDLGGHSLLATQLMSRVRDAFQVEIGLRQLFDTPTVSGFAVAVEEAQREGQGLSAPPIVPVSREQALPLSFAQQRLWFLDQLEPNSALYNIPLALKLSGELDLAALEQSFNEIIRRHEVLRTTFAIEDEQPVQLIHPAEPLRLAITDLTGFEESERERQARQLIAEEARRPFDLAHGPLLRTHLIKLAEDEHVGLFTLHHIVADGWSMGVLFKEVAALYEAFSDGRQSPLPDLSIQYADFAYWQRLWLAGEVLEKQLAYWKRQLGDAPALLELPTDFPRPAIQTHRGAHQSFTLPVGITESLKELSRREGVTLFMALLGAWQVLLSRYSGQADVSIGTPIANRNRGETEALIGFFVNTLVLRTDLSGNPHFTEFLKRVKEVCLGAYAHQDVPFEKLVEELQPERSLSHSPLFQVFFAVQNAPMGAPELPGLKLGALLDEGEGETAKFDLSLDLTESDGALVGSLGYNADLFEARTIERLVEHFQTLLSAILADPKQRISSLPMMSEDERQKVLCEWNATTCEYPHDTFIREFEAQVERSPDTISAICEDEQLTYRELNERANQLAHYLHSLGVKPDSLVGICVERSLEMVVGLLGILKAGGAYLPLDPAYPQERLAFMLADSGADVLLTEQSLLGRLPEHAARVVLVDSDWPMISTESVENAKSRVSAENLAYVIYTSGSTGRPKGVMISHRSLINFLSDMQHRPGLSHSDTLLSVTTLSFDISALELFLPLSIGARLVIASREEAADPMTLTSLLSEQRVTVMQATPATWRMLVEAGWEGNSALRVLCGGEALSAVLAEQLVARSREVWNLYGPTETTIWSGCWSVAEGLAVVRIGQPIANTQFYVLDKEMQVVPIGVSGELYIGGDGLARGYLKRAELTAERFVPNPFGEEAGARLYRTGDAVRWSQQGELEYLGRIDNQVKVRGFRIELGEIEAALGEQESIRECVVVAREDVAGDKRLVAYVVVREGEEVVANQLRELLRERLPEYMMPQAFVLLEEMPLTPNGKVDRKRLPAPEQDRLQLEQMYVAPRTPVEETLAAIWQHVLRVERVGVEDNFFELGGHSLLATRLISRVRQTFEVEIALRELFERPTVAGLSQSIERARHLSSGELSAPPLLPVSRDGRLPLSFAQERLWFLDQLEPGSASYNMPAAARLVGKLDVAAMHAALNEIIRRHEVLRTTFASADGEPMQVIASELTLPLPVIDLTQLPAQQREAEALRLSREEAARPFDLSTGPLVRATLLCLSEAEHVLLLTMHHIISDGWSMGLLVKEVAALYEAYSSGQPSPLAELPIQYADYAVWQRGWLRGEVLDRQVEYWKRQLEGVETLQLPTDHARPPVQTFNGAYYQFELPEGLSAAVRQLGQREGTTLYMTLLAAFQTLLSRYTGQSDISVGTPIAGRTRLETEALIGFFVNTLVLRTQVSGEESFTEVLRRVRELTLEAQSHQDVPFEKLVEELQPERDLSRTPLFQVMFTLQNMTAQQITLPDLRVKPFGAEGATAKFDLTLSIEEGERGLSASFEYSTDLFEAATISRMAAHFQTLLEAIVNDPDQRVSELPLLAEKERHQLLYQWNETEADYPRDTCVHELFEQQAARTPEAVALIHKEQQLTYRELNERANQLAHHLQALGISAEVPVGICIERSIEMVVGLLGILKAGGAYVPLDPAYPQERLAFMLEDSDVNVLLTQQRLSKHLPEHHARIVCLDSDWSLISRQSVAKPVADVKPENLAYVIYTSGSTGRPKGVAIAHSSAATLLYWAAERFAREDLAGVLASTSICFDLSVFELFVPLGNGGKVILAENALALPAMTAAQEITLINTVPSAMTELVRAGAVPHSVRVVNLAGEPLKNALVQQIYRQETIREVVNLYGPSEDTTYSTVVLTQRGATKEPTIGRPIANTQTYILDGAMQATPVGVAGELYIGGCGLARCYLNRPELTAERFVPDPFSKEAGRRLYRTGDLARYRADGEIEFLGRIDHQVKVRGFRIELGEIEVALSQHVDVKDAVVLAREITNGELSLVTYVVPEGEGIQVGMLREFLKERLPEFMIPSSFVVLDKLPLTPNGKVDRRALPAPGRETPAPAAAYVAPRDLLESELAHLWEEVLGLSPIGVESNFFELGGHSLLAARLFALVERRLGTKLPLATLFRAPTVAQLAEHLRQQAAVATRSPLVEIQRGDESQRPLFFVHPVGGNVLSYGAMARHLDPAQPFYAFQSPALGGEPLAASVQIESMAARYLEELRAVQPEGPYMLGGWSLGGVVAFEMARQLDLRGEEVALLALLDSHAPTPDEGSDLREDEAMLLLSFAQDMGLELDGLTVSLSHLFNLEPDDRLAYVLEQAKAAGIIHADVGLEQIHLPYQVFKSNLRAMRGYAPRAYPGRITLFKADEPLDAASHDSTNGWRGLAAEGIDVHVVPGSHYTMMREPHLAALVEELNAYLYETVTG